MGTISTPLLILLAIHINLSISQRIPMECTFNSDSDSEKKLNCECYQEDVPSNPRNVSYCSDLDKDVKLLSSRYSFEIVCATPKQFHWTIFPAMKLGSISHIIFDNCSLPENDTLSQIVEHFGIVKLRTFEANNVKNSLHAQFFNGFQHLHHLGLSGNQITEINENMFKSIGSLITLDLSMNDLENLESGVFKHLNYLLLLDLSYNKLNRLTKNTFEGLLSLAFLQLSGNDLKILPKNVLYKLPKLTYFSMGSSNNTCNISDGIFARSKYLNEIRITENELIKIPNGFLSNLTNLKRVRIENSNVTYIPHDLLNGSVNIEEFSFCGSRVYSLPTKLFADQSKMTNLTLSGNELIELQDGLFDDMNALQQLALSDNKLTTISKFTFNGLANLQRIELDGNQLKTIHTDAFLHTMNLRILNLQNNQLSFILSAVISPHTLLSSFDSLYLSGNISLLKNEDLQFISKRMSIDLTGNMIRKIHFPNNRSLITNENVIRLSLRNNPLISGCNTYDFLKYLETHSDIVYIDDADERFCESPRSTVKQKSSQLNFEDFTCADSKIQCPSLCQCRRRPIDNSLIFNCSNAALQVVPNIPNIQILNFSFIVLDVHNNSLTELPSLGNNSRVEVIHASNNNIHVVKLESFPSKLRYLDMSHNKIEILPTDVLDFLRNCEKLALGKNPWLCCPAEAKELVSFVNEKKQSITDLDEIKCEDRTVMVLQAVEGSCSIVTVSTHLDLVVASAFLIGFICISTLYYKYNQFIKIWLHSHNLCLWCVDEKELGKNKAFDAFISYSHHDEDFAIDSIVDELENGTPKFRMCVHARDWLPGALISESIAESIANSRRTIIILSRNYLNSMWGQHEFNCAHGIAVTEKRFRVIIIIYGDIGDIELLDPTLKSYLKTNTYLEWGDEWFWKKLRYALTHNHFK